MQKITEDNYFWPYQKKIIMPDKLKAFADRSHQKEQRLVTTNGVFDILHYGHIRYLARARLCGHKLLVLVNSDESVSRLKGPMRPINSLINRMMVLAALDSIDYVTFFSENTPENALSIIRPLVHCKGGDYHKDALPETKIIEKHGGRVVIIEFEEGYSTSNIIKKANLGKE